jgi:hypothetical protein
MPCSQRFPRHAALLSFAMSAQTQAAFSCRQCIPACLHRRAMTIRAASLEATSLGYLFRR